MPTSRPALKTQLAARVAQKADTRVVPGDLIDRTHPLRELLAEITKDLNELSVKADQAGFDLNFEFDGRYKSGAVMAHDRSNEVRFSLAAKSHAKWDEIEAGKLAKNPSLKELFGRVESLCPSKELRAKLVVANAISRILKVAKEALTASTASAAEVDPVEFVISLALLRVAK